MQDRHLQCHSQLIALPLHAEHCAGLIVAILLQVDKAILGWDSTVGSWCRLENHCVLGEDVQVKVRQWEG